MLDKGVGGGLTLMGCLGEQALGVGWGLRGRGREEGSCGEEGVEG